jgi:hypothetical protein
MNIFVKIKKLVQIYFNHPEPSDFDFVQARQRLLLPNLTEEDYIGVGINDAYYQRIKAMVYAEAKHIALVRHLTEILNG